ncbi:MAG: transcriptional regulator [Pseudomonadota bacterium]|nr:PAS domain S-box protein [Rubrivivax sp.]
MPESAAPAAHAPAAPAAPAAELYRGIVEQNTEAIVFADREGTIRIWNRGAEALFGWSAAEAEGQSLDLIIPPRLRAAHWAGYRRAVAQRHTQHGGQIRMTRAVHRDGGKRYVEMSFGLVLGRDGSVLGSMALARDASARRALEDELRAWRDAQASGRARSR